MPREAAALTSNISERHRAWILSQVIQARNMAREGNRAREGVTGSRPGESRGCAQQGY